MLLLERKDGTIKKKTFKFPFIGRAAPQGGFSCPVGAIHLLPADNFGPGCRVVFVTHLISPGSLPNLNVQTDLYRGDWSAQREPPLKGEVGR